MSIPDININYDMEIETFEEDYQDYIRISWDMREPVEINNSDYHEFVKNDDGSYEFSMRIPKMFEDVSEETRDDKAFKFWVEMPAEIKMANTTNVEGNRAVWTLTKEELTKERELQILTE